MAHAGTPTDLAKQATTNQSSGPAGLWRALVMAIVVMALGVGLFMATSYIAGSNRAHAPATVDRNYDHILDGRVEAAPLSGAPVDQSYDRILHGLGGAAPLSGAPVDQSYDRILHGLGGAAPLSGAPGGQSYDRNLDDLHGNLR